MAMLNNQMVILASRYLSLSLSPSPLNWQVVTGFPGHVITASEPGFDPLVADDDRMLTPYSICPVFSIDNGFIL